MTASERQEDAALTLAFRRDEPDLLRFLARRLRGLPDARGAAQDLAQEAYLKLAGTPAPILNPRALLFRIAANLAHNHAKSEQRRADLRQEAHDLLWEGCDAATPERHALARDELRLGAAALAGLPPRARQVLTLARVQGMTAKEIAAELKISTRAVEKALALGVARLAEAMASAQAETAKSRSACGPGYGQRRRGLS